MKGNTVYKYMLNKKLVKILCKVNSCWILKKINFFKKVPTLFCEERHLQSLQLRDFCGKNQLPKSLCQFFSDFTQFMLNSEMRDFCEKKSTMKWCQF